MCLAQVGWRSERASRGQDERDADDGLASALVPSLVSKDVVWQH